MWASTCRTSIVHSLCLPGLRTSHRYCRCNFAALRETISWKSFCIPASVQSRISEVSGGLGTVEGMDYTGVALPSFWLVLQYTVAQLPGFRNLVVLLKAVVTNCRCLFCRLLPQEGCSFSLCRTTTSKTKHKPSAVVGLFCTEDMVL